VCSSDLEHIIRLVSLYQKTYNYTSDVALISYHERIAPTTLTRKKDRYCKLAGLKGITLHTFRHSHVSMLINSGLQPFEIAKRLGHTVEMVNEVYGHLYPSKQKEMVAMMNSIN
jgi:integrase